MHSAIPLVVHILMAALLLLTAAALAFYTVSAVSALEVVSRRRPAITDHHPPVSILKPLSGLDSRGYECLASFCRQQYPAFQIIFGVTDAGDPALALARQLEQEFPGVDIRIVLDAKQAGPNPKVSNLSNMYRAASHSILLISDSDILVGPDYLANVVQPLSDPAVGVVTCMYRSLAATGAGRFEALGTATEFHAGVLTARKTEGIRFGLGASILIRREALERIGGFAEISNYLGDDYLLGSLPAQAGYRVVLSDYVVNHVLDTRTFAEFFLHQMRWARSIKASRPRSYVGMIFTYGVPWSLLFLAASRGSSLGWAVLAATWTARIAMAWIVGWKCLRDRSARALFWAAPMRDLASLCIWLLSFAGNSVEWRGNKFKLARGGRLVPVAPALANGDAGPQRPG